jgi:hypothetical protein
MMQSYPCKLLFGVGFAAILVACGGGNSGVPTPTPPAATPTSGVAVDGYLKSATATCDTSGDGLVTDGEVSVTTTAAGKYTFPSGCNSVVIVTGGIDTDTDNAFKGVLKAPAGATVATPLTTLLVAGMTQAQIRSSLGIADSVNLSTLDPAATKPDGTLVNPEIMKKSLMVQQLIQTTADTFAGLVGGTGNAMLQPIYSEVASAFATALKGKTLNTTASTLDATVLTDMVAEATRKVAGSNAVSGSVKSAVAALDPGTLAEVTAGSFKVQAETLMSTSESNLKQVTKSQQNDDKIAAFVAQKKTELSSSSPNAVAVLRETLSDKVKDPVSTVAPTNYLALVDNAISLLTADVSTKFTMAAFKSDAGISVNWPMSSTAAIKFTLNELGAFTWAEGQTLSAALKITETGGGQGQVLAYIDKVGVKKTASGMEFLVPNDAVAKVYGVSADGKKKAVINFSTDVRGVRNTLGTKSSNTVLLGDVINHTINNVSNDFTGINTLSGKYKVSLVVNNLPLRQVDGTKFTILGIDVPVELDKDGKTVKSVSVAGAGLEGYISLDNASSLK